MRGCARPTSTSTPPSWTTRAASGRKTHLGAYIRNGISRRDAGKVEDHLGHCRSCAAIYLELSEVNSNLGAILAPLLLGGVGAAYASAATGIAAPVGAAGLLGRVRDVVAANAQAVAVAGVTTAVALGGGGFLVWQDSQPPAVVSGEVAGSGLPGGPADTDTDSPSDAAAGTGQRTAPAPGSDGAAPTAPVDGAVPVTATAPVTVPTTAPSTAPTDDPSDGPTSATAGPTTAPTGGATTSPTRDPVITSGPTKDPEPTVDTAPTRCRPPVRATHPPSYRPRSPRWSRRPPPTRLPRSRRHRTPRPVPTPTQVRTRIPVQTPTRTLTRPDPDPGPDPTVRDLVVTVEGPVGNGASVDISVMVVGIPAGESATVAIYGDPGLEDLVPVLVRAAGCGDTSWEDARLSCTVTDATPLVVHAVSRPNRSSRLTFTVTPDNGPDTDVADNTVTLTWP